MWLESTKSPAWSKRAVLPTNSSLFVLLKITSLRCSQCGLSTDGGLTLLICVRSIAPASDMLNVRRCGTPKPSILNRPSA